MVNVSVIKPIDVDTVAASLEQDRLRGDGRGAQHNRRSGRRGRRKLPRNVARCRIGRLGIKDVFGKSGTPDQLLEEFHLTTEHLVELAEHVLASSR